MSGTRLPRVAFLADVHGNLPALEAVLAEASALEVETIVCGGDLVPGPFPRECLDLLLRREATFVRGNGDREPCDWAAARLDPLALEFLGSLPESVVVGSVLYCHGSPRSDEEILTRVSPVERVRAALTGVAERVVVAGHTHVQYERDVGAIRLVNAGSVGLPYEGRPGAFWALVEGENVELRRTTYQVDAAATAIRASGYPGADDLVATLLDPPDPDEVSAHFESLAA